MPERADDLLGLDDALHAPQLPAHLYLHVPFCRSRCSYCDFYSSTDLAPARVEMLLRGIEAELTRWQAASLPGVLETVYVGGGTPSIIGERVTRLIKRVFDRFTVHANAEITVEANPESLTPKLVLALADSGVTRVSLGVQSFVDSELAMLGRAHSAAQARSAADMVRTEGLDLSVDLMCGVPGQTAASWTTTLEAAVEAGSVHVSVYPLALEEGTPLAVACGSGLVEEPDPDVAATMMLMAEEFLAAYGLARYEIANYARDGHESRHNLAYWTGRAYMGCGPAAHSMLDAATARAVGLLSDGAGDDRPVRVRYSSPADIGRWLTSGETSVEFLSESEAAREDVMLGLRLVRGVPADQVEAAGLTTVLESLARDGLVGLIEDAGGRATPRWATTRRGWLLGNEVFERVWTGE